MSTLPVRAVFFDVGETILDESRFWYSWADWLRVPRFAFFGLLGSVIERGEHHRKVFELLRPGVTLDALRAERRADGVLDPVAEERDLYPDTRPCLQALAAAGLRVGLVGNQPQPIESALAEMGLQVDFIASSERWGVAKPAPEFFERVIDAAALPPAQIAYVGDRLDNDVFPARAAGMLAVFIRRGPWGFIHARRPEVAQADLQIDGLDELLPGLQRLGGRGADG